VFIEAKVMDAVVTTGPLELISRANHHHQQTNAQFFTERMSFLSPNQQCRSTEGNVLI